MKRLALALFIVGLFLIIRAPAEAQAPPPRAEQPHPDVFSCGVPNCQLYNPTNMEAKETHAIQYQLLVMPGCVAGLIESDLEKLRLELDEAVRFRFERNDAASDFTIRVNCGIGQFNICGSVNIWCLGRGFPGVADVDASDIMYSPVLYPEITRLSILCHEICGHALATWNEQYCLGTETTGICKGLTKFANAPGWVDFMNTGPNSRHLFESIELERWARTMYQVVQEFPYWDAAAERWRFEDGRSFHPNSGCGEWFNAANQRTMAQCDDAWNGRYVVVGNDGVWLHRGTPVFTFNEWWSVP